MNSIHKFLLISLFTASFNPLLKANNKNFFQVIIGLFSEHDSAQKNAQKDSDIACAQADRDNYGNWVDYSKVRQEFRNAFNTALEKTYQTLADQEDIARACEKSSNEVINLLQTNYSNFSEAQAKIKAHELAYSAAVQFVGDRSEQIARYEIARMHKPAPFNPTYLAQKIKEEIIQEASACINSHYSSLHEYAGERLRNKVSYKVRQAFNS